MKKKLPQKRQSKRLYIYMAFVTMAAVHLFAKPIKKGWNSLRRCLRKNSAKNNLRAQLALGADSSRIYVKKRSHHK